MPSAKADNCPDVAVTFARGTDEPNGLGLVGQALVDSLRQNTGKNIDAYPVNYRATLLQLHGNDGAKDAIKHIKDVADKCPATPQVLGGYSQGASVVDIVTGTHIGGVGWGDSLPPQYASHIIAVTTFGNPADRSGGTIAAQSAMFGAKAVDYCNPEDPICHAGQGNEWRGTPTATCPSTPARPPASCRPGCCRYCPPPHPTDRWAFRPAPGISASRRDLVRARYLVRARCLVRVRCLGPAPTSRVRPWSARPSPRRFTDQAVTALILQRRTTVGS